MNWWDGIDQVDFNDKANFFTPGNYTARVESAKTHKGYKGHFLIVSFSVVTASNDVQPGEHRDCLFALDGQNARMALGDLKSFVFGLFGLDKENRKLDETAKQIIPRMLDASNPIGGMIIGVEAFEIDVKPSVKNPEGKFTKLRWHTQPNEKTAAQVLAGPIPVVPPPAQAGAPPPPPPPPAGKVRPPNLPATHIRADGAWWDGTAWNP